MSSLHGRYPSTSSRPSALPAAASLDGIPVTSAQLRVADKQRELESFQTLRAHGKALSVNLSQLATELDTLALGGEAVESVVENWQNVFRATHLALGLYLYQAIEHWDGADTWFSAATLVPNNNASVSSELPETLVRIGTGEVQ